MKIFLVSIFVFCISNTFSQTNYDDIRGEFIRYCGNIDSLTTMKNVKFVDSVAKLSIHTGLDHFLEDYSSAYYSKYLITNERNDLIVAINADTRSWERFGNTHSLYELVSSYAAFDCEMSKKYRSLLLDKINRNELDFPDNKEIYLQQLDLIKEHVCPE